MKLLTQSHIIRLQEQHIYGNDLGKQKVIAKVYDPCGLGTWYLLNMNPLSPDCILAIIREYTLEIYLVSLAKLQAYRGKFLGMPLEVDPYFLAMNAQEVWNRLKTGEQV